MHSNKLHLAVLAAIFSTQTSHVIANDSISELDNISITATKIERASKEVPQSVAVIDEQQIERENAMNINDVIDNIPGVQAISKNNGYDSRLIIRGAGLKAPYGVREIMVIRDGVPMTDPDSFTRFDLIDIDDMEGVEIYKGPGSIFASNASGGVVFIKSKSVFDEQQDRVKVGVGSFGSRSMNAKKSITLSENDSLAINFSRRQSDNDWRDWNDFDTTQFSLKHGHMFDDDSVLETEIAYTESNLQLPQSLNASEFEAYKDTGETTNTSSAWRKNGRYSNMLFVNSRYETTMGEYTFKPQVYFTKWGHFHPVTGMINDAQDNQVFGTDLAWNKKHELFGNSAEFLFGLTARTDIRNDGKKYEYADYSTGFGGRISEVLTDDKGTLAQVEDSQNTILGAYIQDSFSPIEKLMVDIGLRYDRVDMSIDGNEYRAYNWSTGVYEDGTGAYSYDETYHLFSPKIGLTYALNDELNIYGLVASSNQAPTESEMQATRTNAPINKELDASTSTNFEIGLKHRSKKWSTDLAVYLTKLNNEIVKVDNGDDDYYENAGETDKKGIELTTAFHINPNWSLGFSGSKTEYRYVDYLSGSDDYSGNSLRFSPDYQYSIFADWKNGPYKARIETTGVGEYYMDDANTEKYSGYSGVSHLTMGYANKGHNINLSIHNLTDERYASEVSKTIRYQGPTKIEDYYYTPGSPRNIMLSYQYKY
ncbi:TonB-dependent receptor [Thiomicrorhabdus lithotrophica]|uniref:TonB-dependent receptor n=1 Tax=Thiomicrorhabdus lithotrophica TaxID=2949997 RepID=A0ABY8CD33_9GAMM|nr:TonB-dependent receptor [Thiomicrorhabdus lithotrophica]WEJ62677.1 TonB-dependent receptor [Thiomicrorhabdus lithotrophica]